MKFDLENKEWKEFSVKKLFEIDRGKRLISRNRIKGNIPLVTAGFNNEGVAEFIENEEQQNYCNSLTIDMFGNVFYRNYIFKCDDNIHVLKNKYLNHINGNFIVNSIKQTTKDVFSYGKQFRLKTLEKLKILLPTNSKGEPDYKFMEQYMRHKEQEKQKEYQNYIKSRLKELKNTPKTVSLEEKEWGEFEIETIFKIKSGVRLTKADMKNGNIPFIGATDSNNGITKFISNTNSSKDRNVLGVNYNGSVVENFYHSYTAIFSDDVKRLSLKNIEGNEFMYLFFKTIILKQKIKYQYGYKFNGTRMKRQKIMLPINNKNEPDYVFMKNYMKNLEYKKLNEYIEFKKN